MRTKKPADAPPEDPATATAEPPSLSLVRPDELAKSPVDEAAAPAKVAAPTMGRTVFFTDEAGVTSPAVITGVDFDGTVSLEVFYRDGVAGLSKRTGISYAPGVERVITAGHGWHWPPRK